MTVLVLKTANMLQVREFFEGMGFEFVKEQHGSGPVHYAAQRGDHVLEVYPMTKGVEEIKMYHE